MRDLKQSTAVTVVIGQAVDATDGITPKVGLTAGTVDEIGVWKHEATAITDISGTTTLTHRANGTYTATLSTADTGTLGHLRLTVVDTSVCVPFHEDFHVITANAWDSKYGADTLQVDVTQIGGDATSATDLKDFADAGYDPATNQVEGVKLTDTTTNITNARGPGRDQHFEIVAGSTNQTIDVMLSDATAAHKGLTGLLFGDMTIRYRRTPTETSQTLTPATQTVGGAHSDGGFVEIDATNMPGLYRLDLPDAVVSTAGRTTIALGASGMVEEIVIIEVTSVDKYDSVRGGMTALPNAAADAAGGLPISDAGGLDMDAILVDTNALNDTKIPDTISLANINAQVDTALVDIKLDHLIAVAETDEAVDNSIIAKLASATSDWSTFSAATDSLEAVRDRGDSAWTTGAGGSDRLLLVDTTIATLASQTSFTLTDGSTDDNAYRGRTIVIEDASTANQKAVGVVDAYTGSTKTVTLLEDPGIFTMAITDKVYILAEASVKPTVAADYHVDVTSGGAVGIDWGNVENPTTAVDLSATDIQLCDTITTYTGNTVQTGDAFARLGAPAGVSVSADIATVDTVVDGIQTDLDNPTDGLGALKALIDTVDTVVDGIKAVTDLIPDSGAMTSIATAAALTTVDTVVDAIKLETDKLTLGNAGAGVAGSIIEEIENLATAASLATVETKVDTVDTVVDAIKVVTDALPNAGALTTIDTNIDSILADTGTDGVVLSAATQNAIADALLDRDMSTGTDTGTDAIRTPRQALRKLRNKWSISGTTLTITKEDDTTTDHTETLTTDASADPVTASDPTGP